MRAVSPDCAMHPILPLALMEVAWADETGATLGFAAAAQNYHYEFNMAVRGWDAI